MSQCSACVWVWFLSREVGGASIGAPTRQLVLTERSQINRSRPPDEDRIEYYSTESSIIITVNKRLFRPAAFTAECFVVDYINLNIKLD